MDRKAITEANRAAWNEVTPIHQQARKLDLRAAFQQPGFSTLDETLTAKLTSLPIRGKKVAQLCCNNGRELLSMLNLGAVSGVGFDISDAAILEAQGLAEISGLPVRFVRTDVYDIGAEHTGAFDLVLITAGALAWLPDLPEFFRVAARVLKTNGLLAVYETHPILNLFAFGDEPGYDPNDPLRVANSYFKTEPWIGKTGIDYIGNTTYDSCPNYSFTQTLASILTAAISSGLAVREFHEYAHDISAVPESLQAPRKLPLSYLLVAEKRGV